MHSCHSVLHFTNSTLWGGVEEHISGLLNNLSRERFRAHLVCSPALQERFSTRCHPDVQITPLSLLDPRDLRAGIQLARLLRREKFTILHSHMFRSSLCACPIAWGCQVPVIIETLHGTEAWRKGWKAQFWVDRLINPIISSHVAVCASDAKFLASKKHVAPNKITVIHNGVDLRRFCPSEDIRRTMRERLGCSEQDVVIIAIARFHAGKGHAVLFNALRFVVDRFANVQLICLGEGEEEAESRRICNGLGLARHVRMQGYEPNVEHWLQAADINVLPSFYEGLPLTVLEAMAARVPTVASNVGGIPELVTDGVDGLLVPPGDATSLASALLRLARDKDLRRSMGVAAGSRVSESFDLESQIHKTEQLYLDLYKAAVPGPPLYAPSLHQNGGIVAKDVFRLPPANG